MQRDHVRYSLEFFRQLILRTRCGAENFPCRPVLRIGRLPLGPPGLLTERYRGVEQFLENELQAGIGHDAEGNSGRCRASKPYRVALDRVRLGGEPYVPNLTRFLTPRQATAERY